MPVCIGTDFDQELGLNWKSDLFDLGADSTFYWRLCERDSHELPFKGPRSTNLNRTRYPDRDNGHRPALIEQRRSRF